LSTSKPNSRRRSSDGDENGNGNENRKLLTDPACRKYTPGSERRRIRDLGSRSLYFIIETSGFKSWEMRFRRPGGKPAKVRLGPFDINGKELKGEPEVGQPLSLSAARQLAASIHRSRAMGADVIADIKAKRLHQRVALEQKAANGFAACARDYINEHAKPKTRRWRETATVLGLRYGDDGATEIIPDSLTARWADRDVNSITDFDLFGVIEEARKVGIPGRPVRNTGISEARAHSMHATVRGMFGWLKRQRRIAADPSVDLHPPTASRPRERVLSPDEIRWFWRACESADMPRFPGAPRPFRSLLRFLLLVPSRLNEAAQMVHDELRDDGTWHLPGTRSKNHRGNVLHLPKAALDQIAAVPGDSGYVFSANGKTPVVGFTKARERLRAAVLRAAREERGDKVVVAPWVLHDLRRTVATGMAEIGIQPHIIEAVLNHVGHKTGIHGVYNIANYSEPKRLALEAWAAHVANIVAGAPKKANVVPIKRGKAARKP
jgi:integrase